MTMTLKTKVLQSLGWAVGAKVFGQGITWGITLYVIRILSPEDYGLMAIATMFITVLQPMSELRLGAALVQQDIIDVPLKRKTFGLVLTISCVLCLVLILSAEWIASVFDVPKLDAVVQVLSLSLIVTAFAVVPKADIQRSLNLQKQSIVEMVSSIAGGITAAIFATFGYGVWALVWAHLISVSIVSFGVLTLTRAWWLLPDFNFRGLGKIMRFGGWSTLTHLTWVLSSQIDVIIIGKMLGEKTLGFYSVAKHLAELPHSRIQGVINSVALPAYRHAKTSGENPTYYLEKYLRLSALVAFPVFVGLSSVAPEFILLILGEQWRLAIFPLQLLSFALALRVMEFSFPPYLEAMGLVRMAFGNTLASMIIMVAALLIGSNLGLFGVSVAWALTVPLSFLVVLLRSSRISGVSVGGVLKVVGKMNIPAGALFIAVTIVRFALGNEQELVMKLLLEVGAGAVAYVACAWILCRDACVELLALLPGKKVSRRYV